MVTYAGIVEEGKRNRATRTSIAFTTFKHTSPRLLHHFNHNTTLLPTHQLQHAHDANSALLRQLRYNWTASFQPRGQQTLFENTPPSTSQRSSRTAMSDSKNSDQPRPQSTAPLHSNKQDTKRITPRVPPTPPPQYTELRHTAAPRSPTCLPKEPPDRPIASPDPKAPCPPYPPSSHLKTLNDPLIRTDRTSRKHAYAQRLLNVWNLLGSAVDITILAAALALRTWNLKVHKKALCLEKKELSYATETAQTARFYQTPRTMSQNESTDTIGYPPGLQPHWSEHLEDTTHVTGRKFKPYNANDAPRFDGNDITEFLDAFEDYCNDRAIPLVECINRIPRQCRTFELKEQIMELTAFRLGDWGILRTALLKEFEDTDTFQLRHTPDYLTTLSITDDISADKLESFCNKWVAAESAILLKGRMSAPDITGLLLDRLPPRILGRVVLGTGLDIAKMDTMRSAPIITNLRKEVEKKRSVEKVSRNPGKERRNVSIATGRRNSTGYSSQNPSTTDNYVPRAPDTPYERPQVPRQAYRAPDAPYDLPPALRPPGTASRPSSAVRNTGAEIDELTKQFASFSMNMRTILSQAVQDMPRQVQSVMTASVVPQAGPSTNFAPRQSQHQYPPPPTYGRPAYPPSGAPPPAGPTRCSYCGDDGHIKFQCKVLTDDEYNNLCHQQENWVYAGPVGAGGPALDARGLQGKPLRSRLEVILAHRASQAPPTPRVTASASSISIVMPDLTKDEVAQLDYDEDTDSTYGSDQGDTAQVHAARLNERREQPWEADAKEVLRKRSAREAKLPSTRNKLSKSGWKPVLDKGNGERMDIEDTPETTPEPTTQTPPRKPPPAKVSPPSTALEKKPRVTKSQTWLQSQMQDQDAEKSLRKILKSAKLEVTAWDILSSSPTLQDLMFRKMMVPVDGANANVAAAGTRSTVKVGSLGAEDGLLHYLEDTPKIACRVGKALKSVMGLIDTGAEVNVITLALANEARLFVRPEPMLSMVSHTGHTKPFTGVCDDVPIDVGGVLIRSNFFVLDEADQTLVLGNPFIKYAKMTFRYDDSGRQFAMLADGDDDIVEVLVSDTQTEEERAFTRRLVKGKARRICNHTPHHVHSRALAIAPPLFGCPECKAQRFVHSSPPPLHPLLTPPAHLFHPSSTTTIYDSGSTKHIYEPRSRPPPASHSTDSDDDDVQQAVQTGFIIEELSDSDNDNDTDADEPIDPAYRYGAEYEDWFDEGHGPLRTQEAQLLSLSTSRPLHVRVNTLYKNKAKKVRPVDLGVSDGSMPGGVLNWKEIIQRTERWIGPPEPFDHLITRRFSGLPIPISKGSRLTPERVDNIVMGENLLPREKELLIALLFNREAALAFDFPHCGVVHPLVAPPQEIRVVEHEAWQCRPFPIPKALNETVAGMLQDRIRSGALEPCHGPYRNPWFLVKKGGGKYRLINAAMEMNRVTIRDANLPPATDEFAEEFAGNKVASLIDWFSGYDQVPLAAHSRDLTGFFTPLGLLRMTRLPQGATNSVAQFVRVVSKVLEDQIPRRAIPFLDDVGVKGPTTTYNDKELEPGLRQYVVEHIQNLDATLCDLERAGCTIGPKSQFCMDGIKMVGYICDGDGRKPESMKVIKVTNWPACRDKRDIKAFLGLCVYYRIWISDFASTTEPLYSLLRKDVEWKWGQAQDLAMDTIKIALTTAPALVKIDYSEGAGEIVLAVDASLTGWGAVLMQADAEGRRHPSRYESGLWNPAEQQYDATKRECRGALKALKKVRNYLYGIHFVLETDAKVLAAQLNLAAADLPGALVTRWLAWIRLFDIDVRHVAGTKHGAADALSRKPWTKEDELEEEKEVNIDDFIEAELNCVRVSGIWASVATGSTRNSESTETEGLDTASEGLYLEGDWSELSQRIATFLCTLKRPENLNRKELRSFKATALRFLVFEKTLFRRQTKNTPQRRVLDAEEDRSRVIQSLHDDLGHKGREATYHKVADRYWWDTCYRDVQDYCNSCPECQLRSSNRVEEPLYATWTRTIWEKIGLDIVHMQAVQGKTYLVVARDDLSGWVEARPLAKATAQAVAKFIWEDIVCRHGVFDKLIVDGGPENKGLVKEFARRYGIKRIVVSAYHPQANGMIERGHKPIVDALSKMTAGGQGNWISNLPAVLLADRATTKTTTGQSPYYLLYGNEPVLPIELRYPTWRILDFQHINDTSDLLAVRARQFQRRNADLEEATAKLRRSRLDNGIQFDERRRTRDTPLEQGGLVLLHDAVREVDMSKRRKLNYRWRGPFRIKTVLNHKGTFTLEELDGTLLKGTYAGNRLKVFIVRRDGLEPLVSDSDHSDSDSDTHVEVEEVDSAEEEGEVDDNQADDEEEEDDVPTWQTASRTRRGHQQTTAQQHIPEGRPFAVVIGQHRALPPST